MKIILILVVLALLGIIIVDQIASEFQTQSLEGRVGGCAAFELLTAKI